MILDPPHSPTVTSEQSRGLEVRTISRPGLQEHYITLAACDRETPAAMVSRLQDTLRGRQAVIVRQNLLGLLTVQKAMMGALSGQFGRLDWPVTWIEGSPCDGAPLAGMQILAVSGVPVESVHLHGQVVGRVYSDGQARSGFFGDLRPTDLAAGRPEQAAQVFEKMVAALQAAKMDISHLMRTWLFLDEILSWYGPLNKVRTAFFKKYGVFDRMVPASTGIGARNPARAALVANAFAMQKLNGVIGSREIDSPLQGPAGQYGSSFSRAIEMTMPGYRQVMISGTASIDADGHTVFIGDINAQVKHTMRVVEAILTSRGQSFADVTRAIAYFKDPEHVKAFTAYCAEQSVPAMPLLMVQAILCRDDLLFEIEVDAAV